MRQDLWVVTSYFNPCRYATRSANYERFRDAILWQGAQLLTVELSFEGESHQLRASNYDHLIQLTAKHLMWQKERLLNIGISQLPKECSKVAWLDCDLIFERNDWLDAASRALDSCTVLQPYETVVRLLKGDTDYTSRGQEWRSFTSVFNDPSVTTREGWKAHGHTGFAWVGRRDWMSSVGIYDACIGGSADHMMAHAFANEASSGCLSRLVGSDSSQMKHFRLWADSLQAKWPQQIGAMEGKLLHLWHGEIENRGYLKRHKQLASFNFDPATDIRIGASGCWEWANNVDTMQTWASTYFNDRKEDG